MKRFDIIVGGDNEYNITVGRHYIYNVDIIIQNLISIIYAELAGSHDLIIDSSNAQAFVKMFLKASEEVLENGASELSAFMKIYAVANKIEAEISSRDVTALTKMFFGTEKSANLEIGVSPTTALLIMLLMSDGFTGAEIDSSEVEAFIKVFLRSASSIDAISTVNPATLLYIAYALSEELNVTEIGASDANLSIGRLRMLYEMDDSILADFDENELEDVDFIMQ